MFERHVILHTIKRIAEWASYKRMRLRVAVSYTEVVYYLKIYHCLFIK
jgi:hypothetical protein